MDEPSGRWIGQFTGGWAVGLSQDVRQAVRVPVEWAARVLQMDVLS
jgi:hypothetical protein